jgi:hypothetical protein
VKLTDIEERLLTILRRAQGEVSGRNLANAYISEYGSPLPYGHLNATMRRLLEAGLVEVRIEFHEYGSVRFFSARAEERGDAL